MPRGEFNLNEQFGKLILIAGPTAIGKSGLSVRLAKEIGGEVISADSMQVYRGMDIGTAKITPGEMQGVPHHLIDILDVNEEFNAAVFQQYANAACRKIYANGHIPIVCGGTGFYIQALLYQIDFTEEEARDDIYRNELWKLSEREDGPDELFSMLSALDPETAAVIDRHNLKRVIRALEYYKLHGSGIARHNREQEARKSHSPFDYRYFVLSGNRQALYERIDARVDRMIEDGLVQEALKLREGGLRMDSTAAQGIGYKEIYAYLDGHCTLDEAIAQIKLNSRHYAKRQFTWFRREKNAVWIDTDQGDPLDEIRKYL